MQKETVEFTLQSNGTTSFRGQHITGYIGPEKVGLIPRLMVTIHQQCRKEFGQYDMHLAREWVQVMDNPEMLRFKP